MPVDLQGLLDDLAEETASLVGLLRPLRSVEYDRPTPAAGWAVRDQVSHLAYFDEAATTAATDPDRFREEATELMARAPDFADAVAQDCRTVPAETLLPWFEQARHKFISTYRGLETRHRIPWYGMDMSAASCITARLMETWAHGQDIADAVGVEREPTARLRHIADLGVRTRPFSFALNDRPPPKGPVRVALVAPDGSMWTWADDAVNSVEGSALDFCLVVTQRRHLEETSLRVRGEVADDWMSFAQAFAGPPGPGRPSVKGRGGEAN